MDELLIRQAPHSPEAEQAVLGSMLIDADCVKDVMDKLQPEDFYLRQNREIFETIYSMFVYSKPIDGVTVAGEMERSGLYTDDTRGYLVQLMEVTPTSANVMEYVKIVREKALLRAVASAAADITAMVQEGTGEANAVLEAAEQKIYAIRRGRSAQNMVPISMVLQAVLERLGELTAAGGETMPGLTTGFSDVDRKINGLNKSDLLLLAGRPGMGKTSMGLNVAVNAAKASRKTVAVFSLEMSREQLVTRLLAGEGLIDNTRLVTGNLRESDWVRIAEGASTLSRLDIRIDDNPLLTVADMNAKCRRLDDLGLVVIDYLQLMTSAGGKGYSGENRQQAVSDISRMLKIMAKELQVPVLCLSQLSRANEKRDDKRPMLSDLRESGAIEQDADIVMFLYRDDYYNSDSEKRNIAECIVAKNRHGETGKVELRCLIKFEKSMESIPNGFIQMISPILILCFAWTLCGLCRDDGLQVGEFVRGVMANTGSLAKFLPAVIFIVACFIGFATGTSWGTIGIMVPLVCAVFDWYDQPTLLSIGLAASCAGGVCGDHLSPISDTTIMASAGAHCFHLNHVSTQIPYGVTVAAVSFVSFIIAGLVQNVVVCMIIAVALMIGTLLVIRAIVAKKHTGIFQEMANAGKAMAK